MFFAIILSETNKILVFKRFALFCYTFSNEFFGFLTLFQEKKQGFLTLFPTKDG